MSWILKEYQAKQNACEKKAFAIPSIQERVRFATEEYKKLEKEMHEKWAKGNILYVFPGGITFKERIKLDVETIGKLMAEVFKMSSDSVFTYVGLSDEYPEWMPIDDNKRKMMKFEIRLGACGTYVIEGTEKHLLIHFAHINLPPPYPDVQPKDYELYDMLLEKFYGLKKPQNL